MPVAPIGVDETGVGAIAGPLLAVAAYVVPSAYVYERSGVSYVRVQGTGPVVVQPGQRLAEGMEILAGVEAGDVLVRPGADEAARATPGQ